MNGYLVSVSKELRLLTIHAHPDDESSKGAGTVALYADSGVGTTLVCCTGGEEGDILNPAMDRPEVRSNIASVRGISISTPVIQRQASQAASSAFSTTSFNAG